MSGAGVGLSRKPRSSVQKCDFKKSSLVMTSSRSHEPPYDARPEEVINGAKFAYAVLEDLRQTHTETELRFIY